MKIAIKRILQAVEADDNRGFCLACSTEVHGVEPDARGYTCENCSKPQVYGAEELLLMAEGI